MSARETVAMEFIREIAQGSYPDSDKVSLLEWVTQRAKHILLATEPERLEAVGWDRDAFFDAIFEEVLGSSQQHPMDATPFDDRVQQIEEICTIAQRYLHPPGGREIVAWALDPKPSNWLHESLGGAWAESEWLNTDGKCETRIRPLTYAQEVDNV